MFALFAATALSACSTAPSGSPLGVEVDAKAHKVVLRTAPIELPGSYSHEGDSHQYHQHGPVTPLAPFAWPVDGWARGFELRIRDCAGNEVPRNRLHHALVLHLEQRELFYPIYERLIAFGAESEDIALPRGVGMRIAKGAQLGLVAVWTPAAPEPEGVVLELTIPYLPGNANPRPVDVTPIGFDVRYQPGEGASYDVPPGTSTREQLFEMPIDGRLLVAGGHLHQYATAMSLRDEESGKVVVSLKPRLDRNGRLIGVERKLYGVTGAGIKLTGGRRYRLVVSYDNPTGETLTEGGMGILAGLFSPADRVRWPSLDRSLEGFSRDVAMLTRAGLLP